VLLEEALLVLNPWAGATYVDCTAGLGGHAASIAPRLMPGGRVILGDVDAANLAHAAKRVADAAPGIVIETIRGNFALLPSRMRERGLRADLLLADLGFASNQMDDPARGMSFMRDGPLDMRLDPTLPATGADLLRTLPEGELARIIREFGEERYAAKIARRIVERRRIAPIETTGALADLVRGIVPRSGAIDPATRTFQALRIAVNDEIGCLEALMYEVVQEARRPAGVPSRWLNAGARVAVITFHSLEDRIVKRAFVECVEGGAANVSKGVIGATESERERNPRSRSAKLRCIALSA
jgi:16S rRNA (cytosine1402-N4)-methyltransferase